MINKLATILLNSIRTSQPKEKIIRLAKILQKLASRIYPRGVNSGPYQNIMIERFLEVFSNSRGVEEILREYLNGHNIVNYGISFNPLNRVETHEEGDEAPKYIVDQQKAINLRNLLSKLGTREISFLEKEIIESRHNRNVKTYLENEHPNTGIDIIVRSKGDSGSRINFDITPSSHFSYRAFFRNVNKEEIKKVLRDFTQSLLQGYKYKIVDGKTVYDSNIKKYGYFITLVVADIQKRSDGSFSMTLVTIFPNEDAKNSSFIPVSGFLTPNSQNPTSEILTPQQFLSTREEGTDTIAFKIWTKGTEYTDANTVPGILEYPKQLERHITPKGIAKVAKRIGVAMRNESRSNGGSIKVQINCPVCYLVDGVKTNDFVLVVCIVEKESNSKYKIKDFKITNTSDTKQRGWWELDSYDSTR
jgi:hypothetical protein